MFEFVTAVIDNVPGVVNAISCIGTAINNYATGGHVDNQKLGITLESSLKAFVNLDYDKKIDEIFKTFEFEKKYNPYQISHTEKKDNLYVFCHEKPEIIFSKECNYNGQIGKLQLTLRDIKANNTECSIEIVFIPHHGGAKQLAQIYSSNNNVNTKIKWFRNLCMQISHLKQKNFETFENLHFDNDQKIINAIMENAKSMLIGTLKNSSSPKEPILIKTLELLKENCEKIRAVKK